MISTYEIKLPMSEPCAFTTYTGRKVLPAVDCDHNCESCGWNPAEARRRMETGVWVSTRAGLHFKGVQNG